MRGKQLERVQHLAILDAAIVDEEDQVQQRQYYQTLTPIIPSNIKASEGYSSKCPIMLGGVWGWFSDNLDP